MWSADRYWISWYTMWSKWYCGFLGISSQSANNFPTNLRTSYRVSHVISLTAEKDVDYVLSIGFSRLYWTLLHAVNEFLSVVDYQTVSTFENRERCTNGNKKPRDHNQNEKQHSEWVRVRDLCKRWSEWCERYSLQVEPILLHTSSNLTLKKELST